jgi:hypothetical protein
MLTTLSDSAATTQMQRAVASGRCPVCFLLRNDEFDELCRWVGGNVADERNRARLDAAGGFCNYHLWKLSELHSPYSASLVNDYAAQKALEALRDPSHADRDHLARWFRRAAERCPLCEQMANCEGRHVSKFVDWLRAGSNREQYEKSEGLCVPHLLRTLALLDGDALYEQLAQAGAVQIERLQQQMREYARKFAARQAGGQEHIEREELDAWRRAIEKLVGRTNVQWPAEAG